MNVYMGRRVGGQMHDMYEVIRLVTWITSGSARPCPGVCLESCTLCTPLYGAFDFAADGILQILVTAEPWLPERPSEACL